MPYIFTQAYIASQQGLPLMKALLLNYPEDETAWFIDDEYLLGDNLLVALLMENKNSRKSVFACWKMDRLSNKKNI